MIVREREYHDCPTCGKREMTRDEAIGCDQCAKVIDLAAITPRGSHGYLDATVFRHREGLAGPESEHLYFCSWKCALAKLATVRTDYFISPPMLLYDEDAPGLRAADFFAAIQRGRRGAEPR